MTTDITGAATSQTTTNTTEVPTETTETKTELKPEDAARFAQLARREKVLRSKAREVEEKERSLKERESQLLKPQAPDNSWKERLATDPLGAMTEAGLSYEQLLNIMVNQNPQDQHIRQLQKEIATMKDDQKKVLTTLEEQQNNSYNQAVKQIRTEVTQLIKGAPEDFELIGSHGTQAQNAVVELIQKTFEEEGYLMDVGDAAKEVEDYLLEQALNTAKLKKIQAKLTPTQMAAQGIPPTAQKQPTTLSHNMTSQTKPMTNKEKRERAILAFQGKLNQ